MRTRFTGVLAFLLLTMVACAQTPKQAPKQPPRFFDKDGAPIHGLTPIWHQLQGFFGDHMPDKVRVVITQEHFSRFHTRTASVQITARHYETRRDDTVAHETAHLAAHRLSAGTSTWNQFRFIDEGLATILGKRAAGRKSAYKAEALSTAAVQRRKDNVRLKLVQEWQKYWGKRPPRGERAGVRRNRYAYPVGASFVYFVIDTYGERALFDLLKALGSTWNLNDALQKSLGKSAAEIEQEWLAYLG